MLNRDQLFCRIEDHVRAARESGQLFGLLVLRSQRMREFNLLFGYAAGDLGTMAMERAITSALRDADEVLRIGEHDFAVLLPALRNRQHAALAAAKLVRAFAEPLQISGEVAQVSVAIGAAVYPEDGSDPDLLCRLADSASDVAAASSDRFALHVDSGFSSSFSHGDLRDAIAANQLHLFLQPIVDMRSGEINRVESLSRWTHAELGAIPPDVFVQVAERTGLIGELTRWNVNVALRHVADAHAAGYPLQVSVNLSASALQYASLVAQLRDMARFWNVPPTAVVLELTETGLMSDLQQGERLLHELRSEGFGVSIDDFGTGYSSMAYLKRLPATELKIDKSFIVDMGQDPRTEKLVASMIDLSHHLGIEVVAEGVEDESTLQRLRALGCDFAQGYYLGRPAPAGDQVAALRTLALARRPGD